MSKICCLITLSLLAAMAVFLYSSNNLNFIEKLSSMERQKWLEYNNQRNYDLYKYNVLFHEID